MMIGDTKRRDFEMRVLLLFRGSPGVGKSTWIRKHDLGDYVLSADQIRLMYSAPQLCPDGGEEINLTNDKLVWNTLLSILEKRMENGEFTVIDATNSKTSEMKRYVNLAEKYKYRIYCIDMTDVPINVCKERNEHRFPMYKRVPEQAIDNMYARFATQKIPSGITVIKPEQFEEKVLYHPMDVSHYKKVHFFGDLHSCLEPLREAIPNLELQDDELYVFLGDYLDRGLQHVSMIQFLLSIYNKPNVILLEGNHESNLFAYAYDLDDKMRSYFVKYTKPYLDEAIACGLFTKKDLKKLVRKFAQCAYLKYRDSKIIATHGGLTGMLRNLIFTSTKQMIHGVGKYADYGQIAMLFEKWVYSEYDDHIYQVSGHRNLDGGKIHYSRHCFNLEGNVEGGGNLRSVVFSQDGIEEYEFKNNYYKRESNGTTKNDDKPKSNDEIIDSLRSNKYIIEKKMGNISSFNFSREAFQQGAWDEQTVKARGLFIDNTTNDIVLRSYDKWFRINERPETKYDMLPKSLTFPAVAYQKENGFLGLISYYNGDLIFATKSVADCAENGKDYVDLFKRTVYQTISEENVKHMVNYLRDHKQTLVCECVCPIDDPHIIKYENNHVFLLDIVDNVFEFKKESYETVYKLATLFGLEPKKRHAKFDSWREFDIWYRSILEEDWENRIEGYVIEGANGFMVKLKTPYYSSWKRMRSLIPGILKHGYTNHTSALYNSEMNLFYGWLRDHREEYIYKDEYGKVKTKPWSLIELRERFYKDLRKE